MGLFVASIVIVVIVVSIVVCTPFVTLGGGVTWHPAMRAVAGIAKSMTVE